MPGSPGAVIIGAGQAGARAAKAMRVAGYAGAITMFGAEPHLPYERPILSKAMLMDPGTATPFVMPEDDYAALGILVRTGTAATAIDRVGRLVILADGSHAAYDCLLLATGSRVRDLTVDGVAPGAILTLRTLDDCRAIEARLRDQAAVAVIGGGFIGLEIAASAARLGCAVTVVEAAERLLPRLGCPEASAAVAALHASAGITIRLGSTVSHAEGERLHLNDGSRIRFDVLIAGVGVEPETRLAEVAGLEVDDGILVDEYGRTLDPLIFAAGDVTRHYNPLLGRLVRLESWQNANQQAEAAGRTMAGVATRYAEIPWLWSDQGDLNLQMAGAPAGVDRTIVRGDPLSEDGAAIFQFDGARLVGGVTINRGKEMPLIRRLLGQQQEVILAPEALADVSVPLRRLMPAREAA